MGEDRGWKIWNKGGRWIVLSMTVKTNLLIRYADRTIIVCPFFHIQTKGFIMICLIYLFLNFLLLVGLDRRCKKTAGKNNSGPGQVQEIACGTYSTGKE